jgi:signal transduction histidine kinase
MNKSSETDQSPHAKPKDNHDIRISDDVESLLIRISKQERDIKDLQAHIARMQETKSEKDLEREVWWKGFDKLLLVSETVSDTLFSEPVFQQIIDTLVELTGFSDMIISFYDQQTKLYNLVAYRGLDEESIKMIRNTPVCQDDYIDQAARTLKPSYTSKYTAEAIRGNGWPVFTGINSFIVIPCLADGRSQGMLGLFSPDIEVWDKENIDWLTAVGRRMANILYRVRLAKQFRTVAVLEERARLGREFHDNLAQTLSYLNIQSQLSQAMLTSEKYDEVMKELKDIEEVTSKAYDDLRDSILDLRFFSSVDKGFISSLKEYIQDFQRRYQIHIDLDDNEWTSHALSPEQEIQILCIIQEAMTNVRKHAGAKHIYLFLRISGEKAQITVKDDGCGFDPASIEQGDHQKHGLNSMKERAECIDADLKIMSRTGAGTEVIVETPVLQAKRDV